MAQRKLRCPNGHELKLEPGADPIARCSCGAEWLPVETGPTFTGEVTLGRPDALKKILAYAGGALLLVVLLVAGALSSKPEPPANDHGKCNGSPKCDVCKNCSRCEHCSKGEGTCGVCKDASKK
jgi:hypothetical protein